MDQVDLCPQRLDEEVFHFTSFQADVCACGVMLILGGNTGVILVGAVGLAELPATVRTVINSVGLILGSL